MEKKEIFDQGGLTFKGIFMVFKRIWYWLLALIILCGAGYTLLDSYKHKSTKYTYSASVRLMLTGIGNSNLESTYARISPYLYDSTFLNDVNSKAIKKQMDNLGETSRTYHYVNEELYESGLVNTNGGYIWMSNTSTEEFYIGFSLSTSAPNDFTPKRVMATLDQICLSLNNRMGYSPTGEGVSATSDLVGKIHITGSAYDSKVLNVNTYSVYKNPQAPMIGAAIGVILSAVIVLLIYKLDDTIKGKDELESLTGVMFITYIEDIDEAKGGSK